MLLAASVLWQKVCGVTQPTRQTLFEPQPPPFQALKLLEVMWQCGGELVPDIVSYNTVMKACGNAQQTDKAFEVGEHTLCWLRKALVRRQPVKASGRRPCWQALVHCEYCIAAAAWVFGCCGQQRRPTGGMRQPCGMYVAPHCLV